jgi:hypothetical protein
VSRRRSGTRRPRDGLGSGRVRAAAPGVEVVCDAALADARRFGRGVQRPDRRCPLELRVGGRREQARSRRGGHFSGCALFRGRGFMGSPDEIRRRRIELSGPLAGAGELRGRHSEHHSGTRPDGAVAGSGRWVSSLGWGLGRVSACGSSFGAGGLRASRSLRSGSDLWSALRVRFVRLLGAVCRPCQSPTRPPEGEGGPR